MSPAAQALRTLTASHALRWTLMTMWRPNREWQVGSNRPDRIATDLFKAGS